jgi:JAB1/Mov34/MPN/PAD-1 ubiquitin protease
MMPAKAKSLTRTMATSAEFLFASWSAPEVAWTVEYPLEVMDEIRAYTCNELLQLSHGGAEVAGVMFGSQRPGVVRILTWRPISSEYADGDTLRLSHRDRMTLAVQLEVARANPELKDLRPVGWFVSHPHGAVAMTASDLEVHAGFFPESSQVTLVIRPTGGGQAEAGFFVREPDGNVRTDASYQDFVLSRLHPLPVQAPPAAAADVEPAPRGFAASESRGLPPNIPPPSLVAPQLAPSLAAPRLAPSLAAPSLAAPGNNPHSFTIPAFKIDEPLPVQERWLWAIPIALALALAGWMLYHRQKPAGTETMALHVSSNAAGTVQLEWDPNSSAVRDAERGEMDITDDGKTSEVAFSSDQLHAGKMTYAPRSSDVGFQLTVYPIKGAAVHETTRYIGPASGAAPASTPAQAQAQAPQLLPGPEDSSLQQQIRRLTDQLQKERARTIELQNLNRILENRLGIQPEPEKAPQP